MLRGTDLSKFSGGGSWKAFLGVWLSARSASGGSSFAGAAIAIGGTAPKFALVASELVSSGPLAVGISVLRKDVPIIGIGIALIELGFGSERHPP